MTPPYVLSKPEPGNWFNMLFGGGKDEKKPDPYETFVPNGRGGWVLADVPDRDAPNNGFPVPAAPAAPPDLSALDFLNNSDSGSNSGPSAAQILQSMISKINEDYDRQVANYAGQKATGTSNIDNAYAGFKTAHAGNTATYNSTSNALNNSITERNASTQAALAAQNASLSASADKLGWNGAAIQAAGQNNANTLNNVQGFGQDLQASLAKVAAASQASWGDSGALAHQGAQGNLSNNYNQAMFGADQAKSDALYAARNNTAKASSGGGGGSSGASLSDYIKASGLADNQNLLNAMNAIPGSSMQVAAYLADPAGWSDRASKDSSMEQYLPIMQRVANREALK